MLTQRGQSTAEYAIVVSVVIAAVVGMQLYTKRGMQAKVKDVSDSFAATNDLADPDTALLAGESRAQYEPYYTAATEDAQGIEVAQSSNATEMRAVNGRVDKTNINQNTARTGRQVQGADQAAEGHWDATVIP